MRKISEISLRSSNLIIDSPFESDILISFLYHLTILQSEWRTLLRTDFSSRTFRHGHFVTWTFRRMDTSSHGQFVADISSRGILSPNAQFAPTYFSIKSPHFHLFFQIYSKSLNFRSLKKKKVPVTYVQETKCPCDEMSATKYPCDEMSVRRNVRLPFNQFEQTQKNSFSMYMIAGKWVSRLSAAGVKGEKILHRFPSENDDSMKAASTKKFGLEFCTKSNSRCCIKFLILKRS